MRFRKINWDLLLFAILFLGIVLKLIGVFLLPVFHDVGWYRQLAIHYDAAYMNLIQLEHPPLGYYFFFLALKILGINAYVIRLVPFIFSLIEISLIYWLAKKWYNAKTANATLILWSLTFFSYVNALSPEGDGSIMAVFSIFLFYFLYNYFELKKSKYLVFAGVFYGLLMLIKVRAVLFIIPLSIFVAFKLKSVKNTIVHVFKICAIGGGVFLLFPLAVYLANPQEFSNLIAQVLLHNTSKVSLINLVLYKVTHLQIFLQVIVVLSPLYFFLLLKSFKSKFNDKDGLLIVWFSSLFFLLLLLLPVGGLAAAYPRYIAFLLPPLLLLAAKGFASLNYSSKNLSIILLCSIAVYYVSYLINESAANYWFYASAAIGVYKLTQGLLIFYLAAGVILGSAYFFIKNIKISRFVLSAFLILMFSFNLQFILEPIVDQTHLKIINDISKFSCSNGIKKPLFVWAEDLAFYLQSNGLNIKTFTNPQSKSYAQKIGYNDKGHFNFDLNDKIAMSELKSKGGTVFTLYHPYKYAFQKDSNRQKEEEYLKTNCKLLKSAVYKTGRGEVWEC